MPDIDKTIDKQDTQFVGKKIQPTAVPKPDIGVLDQHSVISDILDSADSSQINTSAINAFLDVARARDEQYTIIDQMCQDSIPSAILELYAEDSTATNDNKEVVWVTSDTPLIAESVRYILESLQVNKHIYKWTSSLVKYGDVYVRLFRESECDSDPLFSTTRGKNKSLNEDINIHVTKPDSPDHYANYVEMVDNPATTFELTRFGKTAGFIQTHNIETKRNVNATASKLNSMTFQYVFNQSDIDIYQTTQFVHASLDDNVDRVTEEVQILLDKSDDTKADSKITYKVKSGQSVFYNTFKIWRELSLLETSLILNRLTKSSITRVIQIETGLTSKEETNQILQSLKQLIEQKAAINPGQGMSEYTNPGPIENNIYMPTHDGKGAISTSQIGGDYDPKQLTDLDYFKNKFYGSMGVPKQYFGDTDDGAGFNGGQSLTIISSKYAKKILKIQNAMINMITSLVNVFLIDRGLANYVNKFTINMLAPMTQEDIDRREFASSKIGVVRDVMDLLSDIEDNETKLEILKSLLSDAIDNNDVIAYLDEYIESQKPDKDSDKDTTDSEDDRDLNLSDDINLDLDSSIGFQPEVEPEIDTSAEETVEIEQPEESQEAGDILPTPGETGVDLLNT